MQHIPVDNGSTTPRVDRCATGKIKDQPHLFGILQRLNGLGIELLSVQALSEEARPTS